MAVDTRRPITWTGARFEVKAPARAVENPWCPCPSCWGQGVQWAQDASGSIRWRRTCPTCLGVAMIPSVTP